jgi:hypothetical protein
LNRPRRCLALILTVLIAFPVWNVAGPVGSAEGQEDPEVPDNLLYNGDFERESDHPGRVQSRPTWWDPYPLIPPDDSTFAVNHTDPHNGSRCAYLARTDQDATDEIMWYADAYPSKGQIIPFGGWVRASLEEGSAVILRVKVYQNRFLVHTATAEHHADVEDWLELTGTPLEVDWDVARIRFECALKGPGEAWFDDVYLGRPDDMDNAPIVVSVPTLEAAVGHNYTYQARALDPENHDFHFSLLTGPEGMTVTGRGMVSWTPEAVPTEAVRVVLEVNDTEGHSSYQDFFIRVLEEPVEKPVHVLLYSTMDDHINIDLSATVMLRLIDLIEDYSSPLSNPMYIPKWSMFLSGADANAIRLMEGGLPFELMTNLTRALESPRVDLGYSANREPTYKNNPIWALDWEATWSEVVRGTADLLSRERDALTGEILAGDGAGGLLAVREIGDASIVAGLGLDPAELHALSKYDEEAMLLSLDEGPFRFTTPVEYEMLETLHSMLAEDPNAPYAVYWEGGRLRVGTGDDGMWPPLLSASSGPETLNTTLGTLDRSRVHVIPVKVGGSDIYCNGSKIVQGNFVISPTEWAYSHPGSPNLPQEAIRPLWEREALWNATNESISWLLWDYLIEESGGAFLNQEYLKYLVDPGSNLTVSTAELASAARDLLVRRVDLEYPNWVGVSWGFCQGDYQYFSLSEMYGLLVSALADYQRTGALPSTMDILSLVGPMADHVPSGPGRNVVVSDVIAEASEQYLDLVDDTWRVLPSGTIPSSTSPGGGEVNAMEFLLLLAEAYLVLFDQGPENALVRLYPTLQWPLTRDALDQPPGPLRFSATSWAVKPSSARSYLDRTRPNVRYVTPHPGAGNVPLDTRITVTFSEPMDESQPLGEAFEIDPPVGGELFWDYHRLVFEPYENLTENTTFTVSIKAIPVLRDIAGNVLDMPFTWNFTTASGRNEDPVLHPLPWEANVTILENQTLRFAVVVEDDGPEPLSYSWLLDGIPQPGKVTDSFIYLPGFTHEGNHTVTVMVQDAADPPGTGSFTWNVTVYDVNQKPRILGREPEQDHVVVNERHDGVMTFIVFAEDPDEGQPWFTWSIDGEVAPEDWISPNGSVLTFRYDYDSAGNYTIGCTVWDHMTRFTLEWSLEVVDVNRAPEITSIDPEFSTTIDLGDAVQIIVEANDPDGDQLKFLWYIGGVEHANTTVGDWNFTSEVDGSYSVRIVVDDGRGGITEGFVVVNVLPDQDDGAGPRVKNVWPWLLVLFVVVAIGLVIAWPILRRRASV